MSKSLYVLLVLALIAATGLIATQQEPSKTVLVSGYILLSFCSAFFVYLFFRYKQGIFKKCPLCQKWHFNKKSHCDGCRAAASLWHLFPWDLKPEDMD